MQLKVASAHTTRWRAVATAVAIAAVTTATMGVPSAQALETETASAQYDEGASPTSGVKADLWGDAKADRVSQDLDGANEAQLDPGSLYAVDRAIGARKLWKAKDSTDRALTGQGVSVALLDSGISEVSGLDGTGKVTHGPDLSIEGNGVLTQKDTFGHGTFMAGIIAGRGTASASSDLASAAPDVQLGVAPDAKLLSMKLATTDGSTDVSQVIAALDWVTQHPVLPDGTRVRVINLSYGTDSAQSYLVDPLAAAAENAWKHGIVVVTSAGNGGASSGRLTNPAIDPYVIAVGATDNNNLPGGWDADKTKVATFSQVGSAGRHVDLVAPGTSLVSLRAPGSYVDVNNPSGLVTGDVTGTLFRGSGTSQAAAVVSGSVALLLQAYPTLTPDQVKFALTSSAEPVRKTKPTVGGAGTIDLEQALETASLLAGTDTTAVARRAAAVQAFPIATGQGSINAARGECFLVDGAGNDLSGEIDVQGNTWRPAAWWKATSSLTAWSGGKWLGATWTGDDWQPVAAGLATTRWTSARWTTTRWTAANWASTRWTTTRWTSTRWTSTRWTTTRWTSTRWTDSVWS
ncbi:MAG: serine protease AprX [Actinomycetota bacterium]|nr:serine protease AprX [Actinomycetota bacterium]